MEVRIVISFSVETENGMRVNDRMLLRELAQDTEGDIRTRLFGQGFLPRDMNIGSYEVRSSVED
jgi:hypothetical protein